MFVSGMTTNGYHIYIVVMCLENFFNVIRNRQKLHIFKLEKLSMKLSEMFVSGNTTAKYLIMEKKQLFWIKNNQIVFYVCFWKKKKTAKVFQFKEYQRKCWNRITKESMLLLTWYGRERELTFELGSLSSILSPHNFDTQKVPEQKTNHKSSCM